MTDATEVRNKPIETRVNWLWNLSESVQRCINKKLNQYDVFRIYKDGEMIRFCLPNVNDVIQTFIIVKRKFYEEDQLDEIKRHVMNGAIMLDIGANIGNHTLYFAKILGASKVYAFEPQKDVYATLLANIQINSLEDVITALNIGIGSEDTNAIIYDNGNVRNNIGNTRLRQDVDGDLTIRKLDTLNIPGKIDFIKIDVEGMEEEVLKGAAQTIKKNKPRIWIESFPEHYPEVDKILKSYGYELRKAMSEANYIYIPVSTQS